MGNTSLVSSSSTGSLVQRSVTSNLDMMTKIAQDGQTLEDIQNLTSSKVTDQLKVFLVSQARNELMRVVKLTKFLDKLESRYMDKIDKAMDSNELTLRQYSDSINLITDLLSRSNEIIYKVLRDDSLMTILNTTVYTTGSTTQVSSVVASLKDAPSRERVRTVIQNILETTLSQPAYNDSVVEVSSKDE